MATGAAGGVADATIVIALGGVGVSGAAPGACAAIAGSGARGGSSASAVRLMPAARMVSVTEWVFFLLTALQA
jgi:hypothetical protein